MKKLKTIFDIQCIRPLNFGPYGPSDQGERKLDIISFYFVATTMICLITRSYHTLIIVCIGTMLLGITAGAFGVFALLRKQSLLGDTISHAALPGIALMFLATHSRNPLILILGGSIAGCIGTILMLVITRLTKLKQDTVLGIILSVFFGVGLVLMTVIQKYSIPHQSILNKFLFGSASTLIIEDVYAMAFIAIVTLFSSRYFGKNSHS